MPYGVQGTVLLQQLMPQRGGMRRVLCHDCSLTCPVCRLMMMPQVYLGPDQGPLSSTHKCASPPSHPSSNLIH